MEPTTPPPSGIGTTSAVGFALSMVALFIVVAYGDSYPWHALAATAILIAVWVTILAIKKWWKRGTTAFTTILDEELGRR